MDDSIHTKIAIVEVSEGQEPKIVKVTDMEAEQLVTLIEQYNTVTQLRQENQQLRQANDYHVSVTQRNSEELRIILDIMNRTGLLKENQIHITPVLRTTVRKIVDEYEFDKSLLGSLDSFKKEWWNMAKSFFKNNVVTFIFEKIKKARK